MTDYESYLRSTEWWLQKQAAKTRAENRCQLCGAADAPLEVHHNTYERLGDERDSDLVVLCAECHAWFHKQRRLAEQKNRPRRPKKQSEYDRIMARFKAAAKDARGL